MEYRDLIRDYAAENEEPTITEGRDARERCAGEPLPPCRGRVRFEPKVLRVAQHLPDADSFSPIPGADLVSVGIDAVYAQQDHKGGEPRIYCIVILCRHFSTPNQMSDVSSNV